MTPGRLRASLTGEGDAKALDAVIHTHTHKQTERHTDRER